MATILDGYTLKYGGFFKNADGSGPYIIPSSGSPFLGGQGNVAAGATDAGNPLKVGGVYNSTKPTYTTGQRGDLQLDDRGNLSVRLHAAQVTASDAVSNTALTSVGLSTEHGSSVRPLILANYLFNGTSWDRMRGDTNGVYTVAKPVTAGGLTAARVVTGTTGVIKASAGQLYQLRAMNTNAAARYLHLYDKATAPTLSTDTPVYTIPLAASSVPAELNWANIGLAFATGIAWAYTTDDIAIPVTAATSTELHFSAAYK